MVDLETYGLGLKGPGLGVDSCITVKLAQD